MPKILNIWILLAAAAAMTATNGSAQPVDVAAAKKEARVVVYGSVVPQAMEELHKNFEKKFDVKVDYWRGSSTAVAERAQSEWRAGRPAFDVVESSWDVMALMKAEGLFARYIPPSSEKFPEQFKEKDALITPWRLLPISILYNTDLVKAAEAPKSLEELLAPKWKGKISMPDPSRHTTTAKFLWNLEKLMGAKWRDYVKNLAKQQPLLVESLAPVTPAVIKGEAHVGIAYVKFVKQYKGPVFYSTLDKYLSDPNHLALGAKAARPNAARLYIEYAASPDGQRMIAQDGEFVLYPGVLPPIVGAEKVAPNMVIMDNPSAEEAKSLSNEFRQIFFAK
ncbi:MAG: extracellular solute-binding protein [Deltaproteobacteria bacterium]|nr:extracellular solute-binding protein [Deltaproteobacteria bacterium]